MDLLLHGLDFALADRGVEGLLGLLFELDFLFPEFDLPLALHNLVKQGLLLDLGLLDRSFSLHGFGLKLLQLGHKVRLHDLVCVGQLLVLTAMLRDELVELVHVIVHSAELNLELLCFRLLGCDLVVEPLALLQQYGFGGRELVNHGILVLHFAHDFDKVRLQAQPLALQLAILLAERCGLPAEVLYRCLQRAEALGVLLGGHHLLQLAVEAVHGVRALLDLVVALTDLRLVLFNEPILLLELPQSCG
mmetsp:Transcript_7020/g.19779  ORF Transcript_7020/g.19779 Transcript_7020/m.19779 type:complete len:248 (+) Transcript_7020:1003-1746(+)